MEKIFYHAGTGSGINHSNLWTMFLRYGSEPYKSYASQAVQAKLAYSPLANLSSDCGPPNRSGLFVPRRAAGRGGGVGAGRREIEGDSA